MTVVDINSDVGEVEALIADGTQELLMRHLTSVNIACGGHAGDEAMMRATVEQARRWGLGIGAHPGYPDKANFGRVQLRMSFDEVAGSTYAQVLALARIAGAIRHVKPHGALYNSAARDAGLARAIAEGVARFSRDVVLVGLAGSAMLEAFRACGFRVAAEAFPDRRYEPDGTLRSRKYDDALIREPAAAAEHALRLVRERNAETLCIHGDTPGAAEIARAVRASLAQAAVDVRAL